MDRIDEYLELSRQKPDLFRTEPGGVRILLDRDEIADVERSVRASLVRSGLDASGADVGVVLRDPWFSVIRDAVEFPDGGRRTHARLMNRNGNGAAALPVLDGRIVLIRHFRHAPRRWMWEIPRGGIEPGASPEECVRQELAEEIGAVARRVEKLGFLLGSSNLYASGAHLFYAELESIGAPQVGEGIGAIHPVSITEFERMVTSGEIEDSFTLGAFLHARLRGLV